jgi:hypothetical protein
MTLTEDPQKLLELRQFYLTQVAQFYQQIQAWGTGKLKFTPPEDYLIYDKTGNEDYHAHTLTAKIIKKNADGLEGIVHFFPHGITFLTEEGVMELCGAFGKEELIYMQADKLRYTYRREPPEPLDEGFEDEDWYWMFMFTPSDKTQVRRLTAAVFWEMVGRCAGYDLGELS